MRAITFSNPVLRSATDGAQLAQEILSALANHEYVFIDFASVEVMTPSFANTLMMRLLAAYSVEELQAKCALANRSEHVAASMNRSIERFKKGIRLSSQVA